jgi:Cytochrome c.
VQKVLDGQLNGNAAKGKQIAQARNRGNCLACHVMPGGSQPGSRGPDLSHFGSTGRSAAETYAMVWDMRTVNPETLMPPFGTNEILTDQELRDVVAFLLSSK